MSDYTKSMTIYTIGHSTHSLDEFIALLKAYDIKLLADVRSIPRSRHVPQFNIDSLAQQLGTVGISYHHFEKLGGRRHTRKDSINQGWHNASFRGYADYMQTEEFRAGLDELLAAAGQQTTAIMCAEAVPWRCHRSMIGDALLIRGQQVIDIFSQDKSQPESLTSFAHVSGSTITYPEA